MPAMQRPIPAVPLCPEHRGRYKAGCSSCQKYARYRWRLQQLPDNPAKRVPAGPTTRRLRQLFEGGMSLQQIAKELGCAPEHIGWISRGHRKQVTLAMERAVLAIEPKPHRDRKYVDATGTFRRIRALSAIGYAFAEQAEILGMGVREFCRKASQQRYVSPDTERAVKAMYDKFSMTPSTRTGWGRAVQRARRESWAPPLAWDDETIDDPKAKPDFGRVNQCLPDEQAVQLALTGELHKVGRDLNNAEKREVVARATTLGKSSRQIAKLAGISGGAVQKCWDRMREAGEL
jgi:transposase